ncbi:MAG: hypothetical protein ACJAWA_001825 [Nonlabens sp.]|jgi:hypothetical protein
MLPRYYSYIQFEDYFQKLLNTLDGSVLKDLVIGESVLKRSIYGLKIGSGKVKILAWSQMHGNESSTTRAICELLRSSDLEHMLENIELYIIPILNPDGADNWTRVNANNVDLNRDAVLLSQPESIVLRKVFDDFQPHYCFNLHGQRSIYGSKNGSIPAQLSFLAPAGDENKDLSASRIKAMHVINSINTDLNHHVNGIIGRYNDDFNINCVGDFMMSNLVPTVLFEAGHSGNDYSRDEVSMLVYKALQIALKSIFTSHLLEVAVVNAYESIPEMSKAYVDIWIKNYKSLAGIKHLCIQYHEQVKDGELYFIPVLIGVNREDVLNGHRVIDLLEDINFKDDLIVEGNFEIHSESLNIKIFAN